MKGHTQYISSFLPKDLINDLLITEEDIATVNEEASETITLDDASPKRRSTRNSLSSLTTRAIPRTQHRRCLL